VTRELVRRTVAQAGIYHMASQGGEETHLTAPGTEHPLLLDFCRSTAACSMCFQESGAWHERCLSPPLPLLLDHPFTTGVETQLCVSLILIF
jgi:hypothetical protein